MKRYVVLLALGLVGGLLGGCLRMESVSPELRVTFGSSRNVVILEVVGSQALRYVWDFGDGTTAETTIPKVVHTYPAEGKYLVVVYGYGQHVSGDGGPGPGIIDQDRPSFQLEALVDTRPAIKIIGIEIVPIDPPPWYVPGIVTWPEWSYPASTILKFRLLYVINRPNEVTIARIGWIITGPYGDVLETNDSIEWMWYDAIYEFQFYGCAPKGHTNYTALVTVILSDGSVVQIRQPFRACAAGGC